MISIDISIYDKKPQSPLPTKSKLKRETISIEDLYNIFIGPEDEILSTVKHNSINRNILNTLRPKSWLNDENTFLTILRERSNSNPENKSSHALTYKYNSFFFSKLFQNNIYNYANIRNFSRHISGQNILVTRIF